MLQKSEYLRKKPKISWNHELESKNYFQKSTKIPKNDQNRQKSRESRLNIGYLLWMDGWMDGRTSFFSAHSGSGVLSSPETPLGTRKVSNFSKRSFVSKETLLRESR